MTTPTDIERLKALEAAATKGPWYHCRPFETIPPVRTVHGPVPGQRIDYVSTWPGMGTPKDHKVVIPMEGREQTVSSEDMALIVAMRNELLPLLARIERVEGEPSAISLLERARDELVECAQDYHHQPKAMIAEINAYLAAAEQSLSSARAEIEGLKAERKEICAELGCIDEPGVPLRFVKGLREDLSRAHAREVELLQTWDKATPTERQELDRLRRGWGPSTPTTHQKRWQDVRDCMTQIERAYELCSPDDDEDETAQRTLEKVSTALFAAIGFCSERMQEIHQHPGDKPDYSFTEGREEALEQAACVAISLIAGDPANGEPLRCPTQREIADAIRKLKDAP